MKNKNPDTNEPDVEDLPVRKVVKETGRVQRPSTAEIRYEVKRLSELSPAQLDEFEHGILIALQWALGERKTLRRPDK